MLFLPHTDDLSSDFICNITFYADATLYAKCDALLICGNSSSEILTLNLTCKICIVKTKFYDKIIFASNFEF